MKIFAFARWEWVLKWVWTPFESEIAFAFVWCEHNLRLHTDVPPKKLSFRFRISLSDMTNYKSADF